LDSLWLLFPFPEEPDQEIGVPGRNIELENGFLDERLERLAGILLQIGGHPFDGASQVFSIRSQFMHGLVDSSKAFSLGIYHRESCK